MANPQQLTYDDEKAFRALSWTWAKAADTKDWDLLGTICADQVQTLYAGVAPGMTDSVYERDDYVHHFVKAFLGDTDLRSQHLLGAVVFTCQSVDRATGSWQASVRHLLPREDGSIGEWSSGSYIDHMYERVEGTWKLAGVKPHTRLWQTGQATNVMRMRG